MCQHLRSTFVHPHTLQNARTRAHTHAHTHTRTHTHTFSQTLACLIMDFSLKERPHVGHLHMGLLIKVYQQIERAHELAYASTRHTDPSGTRHTDPSHALNTPHTDPTRVHTPPTRFHRCMPHIRRACAFICPFTHPMSAGSGPMSIAPMLCMLCSDMLVSA